MAGSPSRRAIIFGLAAAPAALAANDAFGETGAECVAPGKRPRIEALGDDGKIVVLSAILEQAAALYGMNKDMDAPGNVKAVYTEVGKRDPVAGTSLQQFYDLGGPKEYAFRVKTASMLNAVSQGLQSPDVSLLQGVKFSLAADYPLIPETKRTVSVSPEHRLERK